MRDRLEELIKLDPSAVVLHRDDGENSLADRQGEDTDDWMAFTTKAPQGQVFSGRQFLAGTNLNIQPITITSQVGEVLYFLRNGNLYRRVLLVAPANRIVVAILPAVQDTTTGGGERVR